MRQANATSRIMGSQLTWRDVLPSRYVALRPHQHDKPALPVLSKKEARASTTADRKDRQRERCRHFIMEALCQFEKYNDVPNKLIWITSPTAVRDLRIKHGLSRMIFANVCKAVRLRLVFRGHTKSIYCVDIKIHDRIDKEYPP